MQQLFNTISKGNHLVDIGVIHNNGSKGFLGQKMDDSIREFFTQAAYNGRRQNNISDRGKSYNQEFSQYFFSLYPRTILLYN